MKFPWKEETVDPIEEEKTLLAKEWANHKLTSNERKELIKWYCELNESQLEDKKLKHDRNMTMLKTVATNGVTLLVCFMTLTFESEDILRSKVVPIFLRRKD